MRKVSEVAEDDRFCGGGELIKDLVKMCDMGLLMGGPVMENACGRLASALSGLYASMFLTERSPRPSNPPKRAKTTAPEIPFAVTSKIKVRGETYRVVLYRRYNIGRYRRYRHTALSSILS